MSETQTAEATPSPPPEPVTQRRRRKAAPEMEVTGETGITTIEQDFLPGGETSAPAAKPKRQRTTVTSSVDLVVLAENELRPIGKEIVVRLEKADKLDSQADGHRIAAAQHLAKAKETCEKAGIKFVNWVEANVPNYGFEMVRKLVVIGAATDPILALEDMRTKNAAANRKLREKKAEAASETPVSRDTPKEDNVRERTDAAPKPTNDTPKTKADWNKRVEQSLSAMTDAPIEYTIRAIKQFVTFLNGDEMDQLLTDLIAENGFSGSTPVKIKALFGGLTEAGKAEVLPTLV